MHKVGAVLLERLANADNGAHRGERIDCGAGHVAKFVDYRTKNVTTILGKASVRRAYYHCATCGKGVFPKDALLDIEGTGFSPGLRRMMALVGAKESFDAGRDDLRSDQLWGGDVALVIESMRRLETEDKDAQEMIRKTVQYFSTNEHRMQYAKFRGMGLFIGSGVIEAGCKTIVGQRLKQSGMRWTVRGANAIIALRCCQISGQWEDYWENRAAA